MPPGWDTLVSPAADCVAAEVQLGWLSGEEEAVVCLPDGRSVRPLLGAGLEPGSTIFVRPPAASESLHAGVLQQ
jgi:hypothetical protein